MTADSLAMQRQIARNVAIHDRIARRYDAVHGEIFNDIEQTRLHEALKRACGEVRTGAAEIHALDFGCGSGNLSRHMLDLGMTVTAADVSQGFLDLVRSRYPTPRLSTLLMRNGDLAEVEDRTFDIIATYSVLHHIPDYLAALAQLTRLCKPGGIVFIDHEMNEAFWDETALYREFRRKALRFDWQKFVRPSNYFHRVRRIFNPRHSNEGDIHVWPDDHIEWPAIIALLDGQGFDPIIESNYLLSRRLYRTEVYREYSERCTDTKMMVFRKR